MAHIFGTATTESVSFILPKRSSFMSKFTLPNEFERYLDYLTPHCFVYFISDGEYTKIGVAQNMNKRLSCLQVGNPKKLKIVSFIPCSTEYIARKIEKYMHESLSCCRTIGEWFKLPGSDFLFENLPFVVNFDDWERRFTSNECRRDYKRKYLNV